MNIRNATKEDTKAFNDLASYCFGDPHESHDLYDEIFDFENTKIVEEEGEMIGGYTLYPFEMTYGAASVKMGGLSCVEMDVGARYHDFAKIMLTEMIRDMQLKGFVFCTLGAFNIDFYRKLGWEVSFDRMVFELEVELFKPYLSFDYEIKKYYELPGEMLMTIQNEFAKRYNGYVVRDEEYWKIFTKILIEGKYMTATVCLDGKIEGYIIFNLNGGKFEVREMVYSDTSALKALFGVIYRHNSQRKKVTINAPCDFPVRLMVGDLYKVESKLQVYMMNRVVDVKKAFELGEYPNIGEHSLSLNVEDSVADWNNGIWHLYLSQGNIRAEKGSADDSYDAKISIQELSRMLIGYAGGKMLLEIGAVEAKTIESREFIKKVFLEKPVFLNNRY